MIYQTPVNGRKSNSTKGRNHLQGRGELDHNIHRKTDISYTTMAMNTWVSACGLVTQKQLICRLMNPFQWPSSLSIPITKYTYFYHKASVSLGQCPVSVQRVPSESPAMEDELEALIEYSLHLIAHKDKTQPCAANVTTEIVARHCIPSQLRDTCLLYAY